MTKRRTEVPRVGARMRVRRPLAFRRRTRRLRTLLSGVLLLAVIVPLIAFVLASSNAAEQESVALAEEIGSRVADRTADNVDQFLQPARQSVRSVAAMTADPVTRSNREALERILVAQLSASPSVNGLYVAFPDGAFRFVRRTDDGITLKRVDTRPTRVVTLLDVTPPAEFGEPVLDPTDDFDPRRRPWYQAAEQSDDLAWVDAYVFFSSERPGVTAALAVRTDRGEVVAVVGADIELAGLSSFLRDLPLDATTEAFIVTRDGAVVGAPSEYQTDLPLGDGDVELVHAEEFGLLGGEGSDGNGFVSASDLRSANSPDWTVLVRSRHIEFVEVVDAQRWWVRVLVVTTSSVTVVLVGLLGLRLTRPVVDLERRANTDSLTGLANRAALFDEGRRSIRRRIDEGSELAVAVCDIDDFKAINEEIGHLGGDDVLRSVSNALTAELDADDLLARFGGDEFVILLAAESRDVAASTLARLTAVVGAEIGRTAASTGGGWTVGATMIDGRDVTLDELIREADQALVAAKRDRKGVVAWAEVTEDTAS